MLESAWVKLALYFISYFASSSRLHAVQKTQIADLFRAACGFLFNTSQGFSMHNSELTTADVLFWNKIKKKCTVLNLSVECSKMALEGGLLLPEGNASVASWRLSSVHLRADLNLEPGEIHPWFALVMPKSWMSCLKPRSWWVTISRLCWLGHWVVSSSELYKIREQTHPFKSCCHWGAAALHLY